MAEALAAHYARALADAVFATGSGLPPQEAITQLRAAEALVSESKLLQQALLSPAVTKVRKKAVIAELADRLSLHRVIRNFLLVVVTHRRTHELRAMRRQFEAVVDERLGWVPADIASAKDLNQEQRTEIERILGEKLGKFIRPAYSVDPALLAGVRARVASREYDATLRGKLESMRQRLAANL
ncbi:MAG TPA: ATP synthase F1 subunit delta [Bryobacteraceae bacterium]|jgi:F-type H+-transporting ATPase subunit delta